MSINIVARWVDWLVENGNRPDPERRFRAELGIAFGSFQLAAVLLLGLVEFLLGTPAVGSIFLASAIPMLLIILWLRRGGLPVHANTALLTILFLTAAAINLGTGGLAVGANVALPTLALFAVLLSTPRMALFWMVFILLQVAMVAYLRRSGLDFPIKPSSGWVETAIDRVPVVFSLASAMVGLVIRRAMLRFRQRLETSIKSEQAALSESKTLSAKMLDFAKVAADGFWETDAELRLTFVSPEFVRMIGLPEIAFLGLTPEQAYHVRFPGVKLDPKYMQPLLDRVENVDQLLHSRLPDGQAIWLRNSGRPFYDIDGQFCGYRGAVHDITAEHNAEAALRASEQHLRLITDNLPALISYIDANQIFRFNNSTYAQWLQRPLSEITGKPVSEVFRGETYELIQPHLERALSGERVAFDIPPDGGRERHVHVSYVPDLDGQGKVRGVCGLIHDVTEIRRVEAELRQLSEFDSLTGLANRKRLGDKIEDAIARSERNGKLMALLFLDIDHFKAVNDTLGHKGGDLVLQEFARRLLASVRQIDTVARLAGDEFVIVLEMLHSADEARLVAEKIISEMQPTFSILGHTPALSVSIGIAVGKQGHLDSESLLRRADHALYTVKAAGRGTYRIEIE